MSAPWSFYKGDTNVIRLFIGGVPVDKKKDEIWFALHSQGMDKIVNVICYKSYSTSFCNRGYVFVEFMNKKDAEDTLTKFKDNLVIFGRNLVIAWARPLLRASWSDLSKVTALFIKNLPVLMSRDEFIEVLFDGLDDFNPIVRVYKFKDYSFVHFADRGSAQRAFVKLSKYFVGDVEVLWANPRSVNFYKECICMYHMEKKRTNDNNWSDKLDNKANLSAGKVWNPSPSAATISFDKNYFKLCNKSCLPCPQEKKPIENKPDSFDFGELIKALENKTINQLINELYDNQ